MAKNKKRSLEEKLIIVKTVINGELTYPEACKKYDVSNPGTIHSWVRKYKENRLHIDGRSSEIDEYEILKKSYALLKKIRSQRQG